MRFGAVLPTSEIGADPLALRDYAQAAEGLGYSHILAYDHVLGAEHENRERRLWGPYTIDDAFHEPLVLFGYLAALTTTIEFATGVLVLPQRQTALVAKQATEVSLLSEGRLRLGVGTGWNYVEYEALGVEFEQRGSLLTEQIAVLRSLWSQPLVDFSGKHHRIDRASVLPRPESDIPIWLGGGTLPAIRRAARLGDGFLFGTTRGPVYDLARRARELVAEFDRDPNTFGLEAVVDFADGRNAWQSARDTWAGLGGSHFSIRAVSTGAKWMKVTPPNLKDVDEHIQALKTFADECF